MRATFNLIYNPFHPSRDREQRLLTRKLSINTIIKRQKVDLSRPTICYFNGKPLLRKHWQNTRVGDGDVVSFIYLPQGGGGGGGGSNALKIVLMIAIAIMAPYAVGLMAGAGGTIAGVTVVGATGALTTAGMVMAAGISMAGNMLLNALIPPPSPPSGSDRGSPSPTYSLAAQGNQARIGQPIPVMYGRHLIYPDFGAMPYAEYQDNDQYIYQLFCLGQGEYEFHADTLKIEDSPVSNFPEITYEVCPPGVPVTLFPTQVVTAGEVSGQELTSGSVGPFTLNAAETQVNKIAVDVAFPAGLCSFDDDDGDREAWTVTVRIYATPIDDYAQPSGAEFLLAEEVNRAWTTKALRKTYKYDVTPGRYRVRIDRITPKRNSTNINDAMVWASLRGYLVGGTNTYEKVTMLAVKMKAEESVSQQSSRKFNVELTRKLPVPSWNATTQTWDWSAPQATRSPAWAIADIFRAEYGAGTSDARLDIAQLLTLHSACLAREDWFDGIFDSAIPLWEAVSSVARVARTRPFIQSGLVHLVRDQLTTLPTAFFSSRNIVKGSFRITYVMPAEETADCVDVEYLDRVFWKPRTVRCALEDSTSQKPAQIKAFGITTRPHAWREGMYMAASNKYRRKEISFETELEGHIPSLGDLIAVQSDIPEWGQAGEVVAVAPDGVTLTLSEPVTWTEGVTHYVMLRRPDGSGWGPVVCTEGAHDREIIADMNSVPLDFEIQTGTDMERTFYSFGRSGQVIQLARITAIKPRRETVFIACVNEDTRVHSADGGTVPADTFQWALSTPSVRPILADFNIVQVGSGSNPSITLSWTPVAGASKYVIETCYDNDLGAGNWSRLGETVANSYTFTTPVTEGGGPLYVRVAAFGGTIGPWVAKSFTPGLVAPPPDVKAATLSANGPGFELKWTGVGAADSYAVEVVVDGAVKRAIEVVDTAYSYTWDKAQSDGGPWRAVTMRIKAVKGGVRSTNWYSINGTNAAPAAPTCTVRPGVKSLGVEVSPCPESDYVGTIIWGSTNEAFVPDLTNKLYDGPGYFFMKQDITEGWYFKAAHYDTYGKDGLNLSGSAYGEPSTAAGITTVTTLPANPAAVDGQNAIFLENVDPEVQGIYGWDGAQWIRVGGLTPGSVGTDELAAGAVDYTKLAAGAVQARNLAVKKHFLY